MLASESCASGTTECVFLASFSSFLKILVMFPNKLAYEFKSGATVTLNPAS